MSTLANWLRIPRTWTWNLVGWVLATALFVTLTIALGGPSQGDSSQSVYSALLIAHGDWACAYPPSAYSHLAGGFSLTFTSPIYTLVSAGLARLLGIGSTAPFPSATQLGSHCAHAMNQVATWAQSSSVVKPMLRIGLLSWVVLVGGLVTTLRVSQRGRNGVEVAAVMAVALSAPVFSCLEAFFHPEDIMAMGLILFALANVVQSKWLLAGALLALGVLTQLYVILALIPLALVVPRERRVGFLAGFTGVFLAVVTPLAIVTAGRVLHWVLSGTSRAGNSHVTGAGGTVVFSADLHGPTLFLVSRIAPMVAAALVSLYVVRRGVAGAREPARLVALVGVCLTLRLVFEVNAFGYYYMAAVVSLVLFEALRGRFRGETVALITLITLAYSPVPWGFLWHGTLEGSFPRTILPYIASAAVAIVIVVDLLHHRVKRYLVAWQVLVAIAFLRLPLPEHQFRAVVPSWCWQLLLVPSMLYLLSVGLRDPSTKTWMANVPAFVEAAGDCGAIAE